MPDEKATGGSPTSGDALGDAQKTQPKEFSMPKAEPQPPEENAYAPSPPDIVGQVSTHHRDSVQPGSESEGVYAPEAKLADGGDAPKHEA